MSGALAARNADKELEKGRVDKTKVKRYWAGRAPEWVQQQQEDEPVVKERARTEVAAPVIVKRTDDPRLRRLAATRVDVNEALEERRRIRSAEIVRRRHEDDDDQPRSKGRSEEPNSEPGEDEPSEPADDAEEQLGSRARHAEPEEEDEEEMLKRRQAVRERQVSSSWCLAPPHACRSCSPCSSKPMASCVEPRMPFLCTNPGAAVCIAHYSVVRTCQKSACSELPIHKDTSPCTLLATHAVLMS